VHILYFHRFHGHPYDAPDPFVGTIRWWATHDAAGGVAMTTNRVLSPARSLVVALAVILAGLSVGAASGTAAAARPAFTPLTLTRANSSSVIYVVGSVKCSYVLCLRLHRTGDNGEHFTSVSLPPIAANLGSSTGMLNKLVFANAEVGYALIGGGYTDVGYNPLSILYATFNGARTWHHETIAKGVGIVAFESAANEIYALTAHCRGATLPCQDYRLERSSLVAKKWSGRSIPGYRGGLEINLFGAFASRVWLDVTQTGLLDTSNDKGVTFSESSQDKFASPDTCNLTATSNNTLWAECPTGMLVSFFYSNDGGREWTRIPTGLFAGTGGGCFDPVSTTTAYLDYGPNSKATGLYRITHSGRDLTAVGRLDCSTQLSIAFTDRDHGLALCQKNTAASSTELLRTSNGGANWQRVRPS
jgi:hypothetical protein